MKVKVSAGTTAYFSLLNPASRWSAKQPGLQIVYGGDPPAFDVKPAGPLYAAYAFPALPPTQQSKPYAFHLYTQALIGTQWIDCTELDPFILNS